MHIECETQEPQIIVLPSCGNCHAAIKAMDKKGIKYEALDANENVDKLRALNVSSVPVLIVGDKVYTEVSEIFAWINAQ